MQPSPYWGTELIWDTKTNNHNAMFDRHGRVWFAARGRDSHESRLLPEGLATIRRPRRSRCRTRTGSCRCWIPKTMKYTFIDTCFQTHHLQFAYDKNDTLWTSSGGGTGVVGWLNLKMCEETGDPVRSQGWTPMILDTNGDGKRGEYTEPNQPLDPNKDQRVTQQVFYAVMPNPADSSIWGTIRANPARSRASIPARTRSETALTEVFNVPMPGYGPRGGDIDSQGVVWVSLGAAATWARSTGASARARSTGRRRPATTAPKAGRSTSTRARASKASARTAPSSSYYSWVDQHNTFGLGKDVPMSTANLMDGLVAYADGKMVSLRVPYPLGFYAKGFDGRIDDPNAGWKGRGLWTSSGDRTPWLIEGGKGMKPMAVHFQLRPDPLAK